MKYTGPQCFSVILLCLVSVLTAGIATAAHAERQHPQLHNTEPNQMPGQGQRIESGEIPAGLSSSDWASIQQQAYLKASNTDAKGTSLAVAR